MLPNNIQQQYWTLQKLVLSTVHITAYSMPDIGQITGGCQLWLGKGR